MKPTKKKKELPFDPKVFLSKVNGGRTTAEYRKNQTIYRQGDPADSVFYIQTGKAKVTVLSEQGKEAVVAVLGAGDFFGEGCLAGQIRRLATVAAMAECTIMRIAKAEIINVHSRTSRPLPSCSSRICWPATSVSRRIWSINCSIRARSAWRGRCCCLRISARKASPSRSGENQPGDARRDHRHDAISRQLFHEQVPASWASSTITARSRSTVPC